MTAAPELLDAVLVFREPTDDDQAYALKTWQLGYSWSPTSLHYGLDRKLPVRLWQQSKATVAALQQAPETIVGFCCYNLNPSVVHFVSVRDKWRGHGIARALVERSLGGSLVLKPKDVLYTHLPDLTLEAKLYALGWQYTGICP